MNTKPKKKLSQDERNRRISEGLRLAWARRKKEVKRGAKG